MDHHHPNLPAYYHQSISHHVSAGELRYALLVELLGLLDDFGSVS